MRTLIVLFVASLMTAGAAVAATTGVAVKPRQGAERAWMSADLGCSTADVTLRIGEKVWTFQAEVDPTTRAFCEIAYAVCPLGNCAPLAEQARLWNTSLSFEAEGLLLLHPCRVMACAEAGPEVCCRPTVVAEGFAGRMGSAHFATASDPCGTPLFACAKGI